MALVKDFCQYLSSKGYNVSLEKVASSTRSIFNVTQVIEGKDNVIFSNQSQNTTAVIAKVLKSDLYDKIIEKIIN
jgi:ABC-type uncharacterized transport system substrate-binding protein